MVIFFKNLIVAFSPVILLVGGVWLLSLRIPGWSLILGLPAVQLGIVLIVFSFDWAIRKKYDLSKLHIVKCEICGDPTAAPLGEVHELCPRCRASKRAPSLRP